MSMQITLAVARQQRTPDGWELAIAVTFHNAGDATFELDELTACAGGRVQNAVFEVLVDGVELPYRGMMKKRAHPGRSGFLRLAPGASVTHEVRLDSVYELPAQGSLSVRFDHFNHFAKDSVQLTSEPLAVELG